jgi:hypothetical protein
VARTLRATCSLPSGSTSRMPSSRMAARFAPRTMKVTSSPAKRSFTPT